MRLTAPFGSLGRAAGRLRAALIDPARAERAVLVSLGVYLLVWTAYGTIAKSSQGLHADMSELIAWSRDLSFGYLKHPPLAAWLVRTWFTLFPVAEWSYYLLAMLMPAAALWIAWRLSADYLDLEKRAVGLALLTFVPFFNFHALKFNVNTVLMPLWAATAFAFLRSYRTRTPLWAALAGLAAAAAMLGKYWSVFLLAGLVVTALIDRRRMVYFRSPAPWITVAVGLVALAPHLAWLAQNDFAPFSYAVALHGEKTFADALLSSVGYLGGSLAYVAVPLIIVAAMAWPNLKTFADMAWPADDERRLAAAAFWAPFLLPVAGALVDRSVITSLWSMSCWTLLPVLLMSPPALAVRAIDTRRILIAAAALPVVMLIASPAIAIITERKGPPPASAQAFLLAREIERLWHEMTPRPLKFVGGNTDLAYGVITYAPDEPRALPGLAPPPAAELAQDGMVLVCFVEDADCRRAAQVRASGLAGSRAVVSNIVRGFLGHLGKEQGYAIVLVPPRKP